MKVFRCVIKGVSPVLINRFKEQDEIPTTVKKGKKDYGTPRYQAENTAYRDEDTSLLWIPTAWLTGAIRTIASDYKLPGTRKSVKSISGGAIVPLQEKAYFTEKYKVTDVEVDSRPCVIQRARIMRHRARLEKWSVVIDLQIDNEILPAETVHELINDAGRRAGFGDFRPNKGGPFGRFAVVKWASLKTK